MKLRVNHILPYSRANGPGIRYTIWLQGCSIRCPECANKDTWPFTGGKEYDIRELVEDISRNVISHKLNGVTITGGEPLDQFKPLRILLKRLYNQSIFLTTGYTPKQIAEKGYGPIVDLVDILCTGPFEADKICSGEWKGSSNQEIVFLTDLGMKQSKLPVIKKEIYFDEKGNALITGFSA